MKEFLTNHKKILLITSGIIIFFFLLSIGSLPSHAYSASDAFQTFVNNVFPQEDVFWQTAEQCVRNTNPVRISNKERMEHLFDDELPIEYYLNGSGSGTESDPVVKNSGTTTTRQIVNNLDNSTYNYYTDNSETINNAYYSTSNTYDYYICETDNYYISYSFEYNYYDIVVASKDDLTYHYFKQYYELPDGRNSYNLTPNDIYGTIFCYDVKNYNQTIVDSDCVALYHLDGDRFNVVNSTSYASSFRGGFVDNGVFDGCYMLADNTAFIDQFSLQTASAVSTEHYHITFWYYNYGVGNSTIFTCPEGPMIKAYWNRSLNEQQWSFIQIDYDGTDWKYSVNGGSYSSCPSWLFQDCRTNGNKTSTGWGSTSYNLTYNGVSSGITSYATPCICYLTNNYTLKFNTSPGCLTGTTVSTTTIGGQTYAYCFGYGCMVDEVRIDNASSRVSGVMRAEPWDLTYAYTTPPMKTLYNFDTSESLPNALYSNFEWDSVTSNSAFKCNTLSGTLTDNVACTLCTKTISFDSRSSSTYCKFKLYDSTADSSNTWARTIPADIDELTFYLALPDDETSYYPTWLIYNDDTYLASCYFSWSSNMADTDCLICVAFDTVNSSTIGVLSPVTITTSQIGGVRPTNPSNGYCYISLYSNVCSSVQVYYNNVWNECEAAIYYNGVWNSLYSWDFTKQMLVSDDNTSSSGGTYYVDNSDNSSVTYIYNYGGSSSVSSNNITISGNDTYDITVEQQTDDDGGKISWFLAIIGSFIAWLGVCINALPLIPTSFKVLLSGLFLSIGALIIWKAVKR